MIPPGAEENKAVRLPANLAVPQKLESSNVADPPLCLLQGDLVSLCHVQQKAVAWSDQKHDRTEVMVLFTGARCLLHWKDKEGGWRETLVHGPAICLIPPRMVHAPIWERQAELTTIFIDPSLFKRFTRGAVVLAAMSEPGPIATEDIFTWRIASSLRHIFHQRIKPDRVFIDAIGSVLAGCFTWHLLAKPEPNGTATMLSAKRLRHITDFIHANLARTLQVRDVAKQVGLGVAHLTAVFKNTTGLSPYEYITQCRVRRAEELIASGEYRIIEAATAVGFYDQSHLNRHFKKLLGCSTKDLLDRVQTRTAKDTDKT